MKYRLLMTGLILSSCIACGEEPETLDVAQDVSQRGLKETVAPLEPIGPGPVLSCSQQYPSCDQLCYPLLVDPGRPGYCCQGHQRTTCTEAGLFTPGDKDNDGVLDPYDNCVYTPNPSQANNDRNASGQPQPDQLGDACDNCPLHYNPNQYNMDNDRYGDLCDTDVDGDGLDNSQDPCPWDADPLNIDTDLDGIGDVCDDDDDNDGILDLDDNCRLVVNPRQRNFDLDAYGNLCDSDMDNDGVPNTIDNCPSLPNASQANVVNPGTSTGDACEYGELTLWRVRKDGANAGLTRSDFQPWATHGVPHDIQLRTMLAVHSEPAKNRTKNLVFFAAGQQGLSIFVDQRPCTLSGQSGDYRVWPDGTMRFHATQASIPYSISNGSLMGRVVRDDTLEEADSFMAVAFDAQFEFSYLLGDKQNIVNAYYDWLKSKVLSSNLETVFLAGHSRGGCLVAQLAKKFQAEFPNVRLIVQLYDPVCADGEMGINVHDWKHNPLVSNNAWHAFTTDITAQFAPPANADRSRLRVLNILSGDPVVLSHSFTDVNDVDTLAENGTVWYERYWTDWAHVSVENLSLFNFGNYTTSDRLGLGHMKTACQSIGCL